MFYVILQANGKFYGTSIEVIMPSNASCWGTRGETQKIVDLLRKTKPALLATNEDPIMDLSAAEILINRERARFGELETRATKNEKRVAELESAAKKDPYTVAAVKNALLMEPELGRLRGELAMLECTYKDLATSAFRLRVENDDLRRKLKRLGGA